MSFESKTQREGCVAEIMTSRVRTATPDQGIDEIGQMFSDERCHHVPVIEDGRPVGMVSARDLVRVARRQGVDRIPDEIGCRLTARDVMSTDLATIQDDASVDDAIERIGRGDLHALIVLDASEHLAGIVTHRDLLAFLMD